MGFASTRTTFWRILAGWCCAAASMACSIGGAESPVANDPETAAALAELRDLTPSAQAAVLVEMERSHRAGQMGAAQIPLLAGLITDAAWTRTHRRQVAFLLALQGEPARKTLDSLSFSADGETRDAAIEALRFLSLADRTRAADVVRRRSAVAELTAYAAADPAAAEGAIVTLSAAYTRTHEPHFDVRVAALRGLTRFGGRAAPAIVQSLENVHPAFLQYSSAALQAIGDDAENALLDGLRHRDPLVRQRSILVLVEMGLDEEAADAIKPLQNDGEALVQKAASQALADYRKQTRNP